jgi:hypothetical protein
VSEDDAFLDSAIRFMPENPKPGQVVTVVHFRFGVVDVFWKSGKWMLKRIVLNGLDAPPGVPGRGPLSL